MRTLGKRKYTCTVDHLISNAFKNCNSAASEYSSEVNF